MQLYKWSRFIQLGVCGLLVLAACVVETVHPRPRRHRRSV